MRTMRFLRKRAHGAWDMDLHTQAPTTVYPHPIGSRCLNFGGHLGNCRILVDHVERRPPQKRRLPAGETHSTLGSLVPR